MNEYSINVINFLFNQFCNIFIDNSLSLLVDMNLQNNNQLNTRFIFALNIVIPRTRPNLKAIKFNLIDLEREREREGGYPPKISLESKY